jgi:hypothetical protein
MMQYWQASVEYTYITQRKGCKYTLFLYAHGLDKFVRELYLSGINIRKSQDR